ncbi:hypothetical protein FACS1894166_04480 [Bacilli bacterium]|nr:hypothetical protein FACS1894166_04480 [Bacilli bacterium]
MHFHVHVIPKYGKEEGFKIGIGHKYLNDINKVYAALVKVKSKKKP